MPPMSCRTSSSCSASASARSELPGYARMTAYIGAASFRLVIGTSEYLTASREGPEREPTDPCSSSATSSRVRDARSCRRSRRAPAAWLAASDGEHDERDFHLGVRQAAVL